jgi:penicillin-binding protein 2
VRKSIADSVNTYYYQLALDMGIAKIDQYLTRYGFGQPSGIDLAGENTGILPNPAWKLKNRKERWYPGDTVNISIGQGDWKVTPLQMVRGTGALADSGRLRLPHLVDARRDRFDAPWAPLPQPAPGQISDRPEHLQVVREGMVSTVHGPGGTARAMGVGAPYLIAGKTGTAQVVSRRGTAAVDPRSLPMHLRHRALFVGYAPADDPQIAVAVAVEGGGYGGSTAAPIARAIFDAWLLGKLPEGLESIDAVAPRATPAPACIAGDQACELATTPAPAPAPAAATSPVTATAIATGDAAVNAAVPAEAAHPGPQTRATVDSRNAAGEGMGGWARRRAAANAAATSGTTPSAMRPMPATGAPRIAPVPAATPAPEAPRRSGSNTAPPDAEGDDR